MIRRSFLATTLVLALFLAPPVHARQSAPGAAGPVPTLVRFGGTLAVAEGPVLATFALYAEGAGGEPLWSETQAVAVDVGGRYSVLLGATLAEGIPRELFAAGAARWVEVRVEGQEATARALLTSVPYALKAADADTIGGKPLSAFVLAGEKTGLGADGLTYVDTRVLAAGVAGSPSGPPSPPGGFGAAGGAGTPNYIGMFTDTTTLGNSVIYQTPSGAIGINTLEPAAAFHVKASAAPSAYFDVYNNALGALPVVYRAARGTPAAPSAVQANDILGGLAVRGYGATAFSTGRGQVMFKAAENWTDEANGTYLQFTTTPIGSGAWAERMRIAPDGRVGIGTATPAQMLSVAGTIESTTGGFRFPDGTTQTSAVTNGVTSLTAGAGISVTGTASSPVVSVAPGGVVGAMIGNLAVSDGHIVGVSATKVTGSLPVAQVTGAATSAANAFSATQTITTGNLALPSTTAPSSGVLTLGGQPLLHAYGATPYANLFVGQNAGSFAVSGTGANVGVGPSALAVVTTGYSNTAIGYSSMLATTTGRSNTAVGQHTLSVNSSGHDNAAFGAVALRDNSANHNSAFGSNALVRNTSGTYNSAFGSGSLEQNTTGGDNSAFGYASASTNVTGSGNSAFGSLALLANTANETSGFGALALMANTIGAGNSAFGYSALGNNTVGAGNSAFGNRALEFTTTASGSSAFGYHALQLNTGASNTAVGASALAANTTGGFNTAAGAGALAQNLIANENSAFGYQALTSNTGGTGNTAVGRGSLAANTTGGYNVAVGMRALTANTIGPANTAIGNLALSANTIGGNNTAVGSGALAANTTAESNSAFGESALASNVSGTYNTAVGGRALRSNTAASRNTAVGALSLDANTTGAYNTAVGGWALSSNTTASHNSALGYLALSTNTTGYDNSAFGYRALVTNNSGWSNTGFGFQSLAANTTGYHNAALGVDALSSNTTGYDNSGFGYEALRDNSTGQANSAFGYRALAANTVTGNSAFGNGALTATTTGSPNEAFGLSALFSNTTGYANSAFGSYGLMDNTTGANNVAVGNEALESNTTGNYNVSLGGSSGKANTTGSNNTFIGASADAGVGLGDLTNATAIGYNATVSQSNSLVLGSSAVSVGIGTSAPNTKLQVVGNIRVGTSGTLGCVQRFDGTAIAGTCSSDARLKANVQPFGRVLDRVVRLQPVHHTWRTAEFPEYHFGQGIGTGLIAQDVEQVFPEMVSTDERGYKMVNYAELPYLTLQAVKDLKAENDKKDEQILALSAKVAAQDAALKAMADRLTRLEKR
jgi:trimeric autotransporter adhesin